MTTEREPGTGNTLTDPTTERPLAAGWAAFERLSRRAVLTCFSGAVEPVPPPPRLVARAPERHFREASSSWTTAVHPDDEVSARQGWITATRSHNRSADAVVRLRQGRDVQDGWAWYRLHFVDLLDDPEAGVVIVAAEQAEGEPARHAREGRSWFRSSADFHMRLAANGTILEVSPSVADVLGMEVQGLVGGGVIDIIHPDDHPTVIEAWTDLLADPGGVRTVRQRLRTASGQWRWIEATDWNLLDAPEVEAVVAECRDVDGQVLAERAVRTSEEQFRKLAESFPTGVVLVDPEGRHLYSNQYWRDTLGITDPDDLDQAWHNTIHPDDRQGVIRKLNERLADDEPVDLSFRFVRVDDGRVRHGRGIVRLLHGSDGQISGAIGSLRDVTEELEAEQEHRRLLRIVEETSDCVLLIARDGVIFQANAATRNAFGSHILGSRALELLSPDTRRWILSEGLPELEAGLSWRGEVELMSAEGRLIPMSALVQPHADSTGEMVYMSATLRDITEQKSVEIELARQARRDPLTGLPNRLAIMERLVEGQRRAQLSGSILAVLFIDLDNLKVVNDGLGHSAGDELLRAVARRLETSLRPHDVLGRFGGDEFVVICPDLADAGAALAVAQRILATAQQTVQLPATQVQLSASIGVAVDVDGQAAPEDLIRDADTAMYEAKRRGKNRASLFGAALRAQVTHRLSLENELRAALGTGALEVWFQPVVNIETMEVRGAEGLVRWAHPRLGLIGPDDFVAVAEESGLIVPLGYEVLATALDIGGRLEAEIDGFDGLNIGVNVSGRQFADPACADHILELIQASNVPVEQVVLELTESVLLDHLDDVERSLHRLRDAGVQLALDDFGSGYSSLSYLRRYPVSVLKLDTSYTQRLSTEVDTRIIAEAITTMAERLGLMVVAEGVETVEQLEVVRELGITRAQGYLLGSPVPGELLRPWPQDRATVGAEGLEPPTSGL